MAKGSVPWPYPVPAPGASNLTRVDALAEKLSASEQTASQNVAFSGVILGDFAKTVVLAMICPPDL
jgi:hypothetical protein